MAVMAKAIFRRPSMLVLSTRRMCWNFSGITRDWKNTGHYQDSTHQPGEVTVAGSDPASTASAEFLHDSEGTRAHRHRARARESAASDTRVSAGRGPRTPRAEAEDPVHSQAPANLAVSGE